MLSLRTPLLLALVLSVGVIAGCDSDDLDDRDLRNTIRDLQDDVRDLEDQAFDSGVRVVTFSVDDNDFDVNGTEDIASFERNFSALTVDVVDEGVVLLYAEGDLIFSGGSGTWTALPYSEGIEAVGEDNVPYVDFTISYSYSYEPGFLYFDVISSAQGLVADYIPDGLRMRLVTLPGGALARGVDLKDYASVKQFYNLPD